ncbi:response regulator, partial [Rubripirellula sp.]|nr:response regulator [Rubripirellula sp.]
MMRALVIDDSRPIRGIIAKIMRSLKFETIEAGNGAEAWGILSEQGPFDVVTVNWEMPEMDGVQFATKV